MIKDVSPELVPDIAQAPLLNIRANINRPWDIRGVFVVAWLLKTVTLIHGAKLRAPHVFSSVVVSTDILCAFSEVKLVLGA